MSNQESVEFLEFFVEILPKFDLGTAYKVRNLTLERINELENTIIEERIKFRAEVIAKAESLGLTVASLFQPEVKVKVKAPPKYQDAATGATWSGKGKRPNWVVAALADGKTLDDLVIPAGDTDPVAGF